MFNSFLINKRPKNVIFIIFPLTINVSVKYYSNALKERHFAKALKLRR